MAGLEPERSNAESIQKVADAIGRLRALAGAPGAESIQADLGRVAADLSSTHAELALVACRKVRKVVGS